MLDITILEFTSNFINYPRGPLVARKSNGALRVNYSFNGYACKVVLEL